MVCTHWPIRRRHRSSPWYFTYTFGADDYSGTYIESVQNLGGLNRLNSNTSGIADIHDTFYAKSLMTPEASPMTITALNAFMTYLGETGFTADTVCRSKIFCIINIVFYSCPFVNHRIGSYKLNYMVVQTLLSTMLHLMLRHLLTEVQCLRFNSIHRPETPLSLTMA